MAYVQHYDVGELAAWFSKLEMLKYEGCMKGDDSQGELHYDGLANLYKTRRCIIEDERRISLG